MSSLKLYFLGPPRIQVDGEPAEIKRRKALALLIYLAVTGESQRRDTLATLFWPDSSQSSARAALRRDLSILNKALGGDWLAIDRETIGLESGPDLWLDTEQFQQHVTDCTDSSPACLEILAKATDLYRDDFLTGFTLPDCPDFDEWQFFQAEGLRQELASVLERLVGSHSAKGDYQQAIPYARRWLALDPLHEPAHRELMQLYAWDGQQAAALRQYDECARLLNEELGVSPSEETTKLFQTIKARQVPPPPTAESSTPSTSPPRERLSSPGVIIEEMAEVDGSNFVARERELARLDEFLDTALTSQGQIVFITGEAGSGKTTLVHEFARQSQEMSGELVVASGICNVYTGVGDPYLPFREILSQLTGDIEAKSSGRMSTQTNASRISALLPVTLQTLVDQGSDLIDSFVSGTTLASQATNISRGPADWVARLKELVKRKAAQAGSLTPEQNHLFEQYTRVLQTLSVQKPLLLILDDLHWADASSVSLLFHLGRRIEKSRIFIIGSYRTEDVAQGMAAVESHPLEDVLSEFKRHFGDVWVDLDQAASGDEGRGFVDALLDTEPNRLDEDFRQALYQHSRGHPLFTVELLRDMQERGDLLQDEQGYWIEGASLAWDTLPARVEGVIEKRIGRLEAELQEALTIASVEGEVFTAEVVAQVQELDERKFVRRLSGELDKQHRLVREQGIQRLGGNRGQRLSRYRFGHNLFQKYLYNRLGEVERAYLHEEVGMALEALYGKQTEEIAFELARHFQEAGIADKAVEYLRQAGEWATRLSALEEAISHLNQALTLVKTLPDTPERAQQELTLQLALSRPLTRAKGFSASEVEHTFRRAWELCQEIGESPELFPVLRGLWDYYMVRTDGYRAHELGLQLLDLAQQAEDPILLMEAHWILGETLHLMGECATAMAHLEEAIARYDPSEYQVYPYRAPQDPGLASRYYRATVLWHLGYPDQALTSIHKTYNLAQEMGQPFEVASTLIFVSTIYHIRREPQAAQPYVESFYSLSVEQGFGNTLPIAMVYRGWILFEQGHRDRGISEIRRGLDTFLAVEAGWGPPFFSILLVDAYREMGQTEEGLNVLDEALAAVEKGGCRAYESEMYWLKGELLQMKGVDEEEIEACYRQAIDIARRQSAKSFELRATVSLSRLLQKQGKREEARQMLAEIYGWFSEGFDTPDLIEAKALLEELSSEAGEQGSRGEISSSIPNNLPAQTTAFIGRTTELAEVREQLSRPEVRLLTLTGPGGTGKTRLGLQAATNLLPDFADGVFVVTLAPISDPALVDTIIAETLGVRPTGDRPVVERLKEYLRDKHLLLVLDNFEHVLAAAPVVTELLAAAPKLKVMATSRTLLRLSGEWDYPVPPLTVPDLTNLPPLAHLAEYEAVQMFDERARAVKTNFALTDDNAPAVAEICVKLDGLPLAIELAAARIRLLPPQKILTQLSSRLKFLTGGARDWPARQKTLRDTIDWSYDLLETEEQILFQRLAVFAGGCTFEAAETVGNIDGDVDVLNGLESLVDKNLLKQIEVAGEPRFGLLETIQEYGLERLAENGEAETIRQTYAHYFMELAEEAEPHMNGPEQVTWVKRLEVEHDNLRGALAWSIENDIEIGLRLAAALGRFWQFQGHLSEGRDWLTKALAAAKKGGGNLDRFRASALQYAGKLLYLQGDITAACVLSEESVMIWRQVGDQRGLADALCDFGNRVFARGDRAEARTLLEESIAIFRQLKDKAGLARSLFWYGHLAWQEGDHPLARANAEESIGLGREVGDISHVAAAISTLGMVAFRRGDYVKAQSFLAESLTLFQQVEDKIGIALILDYLGALAYEQGHYEQAQAFFEQGLQLWRELDSMIYVVATLYNLGCVIFQLNDWTQAAAFFKEGLALSFELKEKQDMARCLEGLALVAEAERQQERATQLFGVAEALREAENIQSEAIDRFDRLPVTMQAEYERHRAAARATLGDEAFEAAYAKGQAMSLEEAMAYALGG